MPSAKSGWKPAAGLALAALLLVLSACATPQPLLTRTLEGPQWPEAPFMARIQWVKSVATPEEAGIGKSFWKKALEVLAGKDVQQIVKPYGVLYDDQERLFIADVGAGVVHLMDTKQERYLKIAGENGLPFRSVIGLAEDDQNRLYITDSAADTLYRYDLGTGTLTTLIRDLERPTGIAFNRANRLLYVSETVAHRVSALDLEGRVKFSFGDQPNSKGAGLNLPTDVATDAKGQVYVTDPLNYKVRVFTPEGLKVSQFGEMGDTRGEMNKPKGIAVDSEGRIYVCDALHDAVQIFDDEGRFLLSFGATGSADGEFWMPSGLFIHDRHIFVSDTFNQRVQIFRFLAGDGDETRSPDQLMQTTKKL